MPEHQQTQQSTESKTTSQKQATPRIQAPVSNPFSIIQRARINPKSLTPADVLQLQRTIGNRAVGRLISEIRSSSAAQKAPVQRQEIPEEEEPLQTKRENNTGMPDNLKAGVESLSGIDMSDVRVHYNSSKPAEVGALAYTQGTNIHVAPGQEKHLPHEAWHVVQQAQGRVRPTMQMKDGIPVNDDEGLEYEADVMGQKVLQNTTKQTGKTAPKQLQSYNSSNVVQGRFVHFHSRPPYQDSDATWITKSVQVAGERPPFYLETINAINERQPSMVPVAGQAIRHINSWGSMLTDLVNLANDTNTIQQVANHLQANWPTNSVVVNPGIPAPLDNETLSNYAESWLDARHNDPENLFIGNKAENSSLGEAYDNPTKAKGVEGGRAGSAFSRDEKKALVGRQITALTGVTAGHIVGHMLMSNVIGFWLGNYIGNFPATNRDTWIKMETKDTNFKTLVDFLANENVFTKIELTRVFRNPNNKTGDV